jgi:hypothetical protein
MAVKRRPLGVGEGASFGACGHGRRALFPPTWLLVSTGAPAHAWTYPLHVMRTRLLCRCSCLAARIIPRPRW